MKTAGRPTIPLTSKQVEIVMEYLSSPKSQREVCREHGIARASLIYWIEKFKALTPAEK